MNVARAVAVCGAIIPSFVQGQELAPPKRAVPAFEAATEALGSAKTLAGKSVACFGRMTTQAGHPSLPFRIVLPLDQVNKAVKQGFTRIDCLGLEKDLNGYKRMVCEMAAGGNDAVQ